MRSYSKPKSYWNFLRLFNKITLNFSFTILKIFYFYKNDLFKEFIDNSIQEITGNLLTSKNFAK